MSEDWKFLKHFPAGLWWGSDQPQLWLAAIFIKLAMCIFTSGCSITTESNMAENPIRDVKGYAVIACFHWWKREGSLLYYSPAHKEQGEPLATPHVLMYEAERVPAAPTPSANTRHAWWEHTRDHNTSSAPKLFIDVSNDVLVFRQRHGGQHHCLTARRFLFDSPEGQELLWSWPDLSRDSSLVQRHVPEG